MEMRLGSGASSPTAAYLIGKASGACFTSSIGARDPGILRTRQAYSSWQPPQRRDAIRVGLLCEVRFPAADGVQEITLQTQDDYVFTPDTFTVDPGTVRLTVVNVAEDLTHNFRFTPDTGPAAIDQQVKHFVSVGRSVR